MTGLENILKSIDEEAKEEANEIIKKAEIERADLIEKSNLEIKKRLHDIANDEERVLKAIKERTKSQLELKKRERLLKTKREQIDIVINESKEKIYNMPVDEYFSFILKLCKRHIRPQKGEIIFSRRDIKRLPEYFKSNVEELAKNLGGELKISNQTCDINSGFIISYGDIEENCSIDALFEERQDKIFDMVSEVLFS